MSITLFTPIGGLGLTLFLLLLPSRFALLTGSLAGLVFWLTVVSMIHDFIRLGYQSSLVLPGDMLCG